MNSQFTILDFLNVLSFYIGLLNLNENLNQGDKQDLMQIFNEKADTMLSEIHSHLEKQDAKIDSIMEALNDK